MFQRLRFCDPVRRHTSVPVPRVISWSSDNSNAVGAEYIIIEKATGIPLFQEWGSMTNFEKQQLIKNLTRLEPHRTFDCNLTTNINRGPCMLPFYAIDVSFAELCAGDSVSALGVSFAQHELLRIPQQSPQSLPSYYKGTLEQQSQLLDTTVGLMDLLDWHTDLHMENIYVSPEERSKIVSTIDFQSSLAQWPVFLKPPHNYDYYVKGIFQPSLPPDFDQLDEESKTIAMREWYQVKSAKAYEISAFLENRKAHDAMNVPHVFRELFTRCAGVSEVGIVPLHAYPKIGRTLGSLGIARFQEELEKHQCHFAECRAWQEARALAEECLDTDAEGWITPQLDLTEKRKENEKLMAFYVEKLAGERSTEEGKAMWPFH
ncbi:uncharacterized protein N7473_010413 [Penicillium subrubescens]|uniref:uncharacterized protein n=1 Tax=Penicillium subrubescens TaxID=1316194 RepID=UPI002544E1CC|nr:uncharacterized protein N7473_010413 [Penicillium subrubescens]KAJ5883527.1 hypothetical protein N7473_010413 [Penicillium subrubescens]